MIRLLMLAALPALGQTQVPFGGFEHDSSLPVEMAADALSIDRDAGTAVFEGNVEAGQGTLRLAADRVTVTYGETAGQITRMEADGNVVLTTGEEAAEAETAQYDVMTGAVVMTGDVLLTQGPNALAGDRLAIDLGAGTAQMEGRVRTIFQPQAAQ